MPRGEKRRPPKRGEITRELTSRLDRGVYAIGEFLPAERLLAQEFDVSRPTLRKALEPLVAAGRLAQHPGIGTQVTDPSAASAKDAPANPQWRIIAVVLPDVANRFFMDLTEAIEYAALQRGYQILLCNSRHLAHVEDFHLRQLAERKVDGVILAHDPNQPYPAAAALLEEASIPTVSLFSSSAESKADAVMLDESAGVDQVMKYLFSLGHRHIAFCRPSPGSAPHPREQAYLRIMRQRGYAPPPDFLVPYADLDDAAYHATLARLMNHDPAPTALFTGNDRIALLVLKHLATLSLRVPEDISVAGFDNLSFTSHLAVPLTTVDQPKQEMGRRAAEMLFERIEVGGSLAPRTEVFQPHLIIRSSCGIVSAKKETASARPADATRPQAQTPQDIRMLKSSRRAPE